MTHCHLSRS